MTGLDGLPPGGVIVTDGSMGRYLAQLGFGGAVPELALFEAPELVARVHREYLEAGARIILTDTLNATQARLARHGLAGRAGEANGKAVEIAAGARKAFPGALVAGDMGPLGELLEPLGAMPRSVAADAFAGQAKALAAAGADFLLLETFFDLEELKLAREACRGVSCLPVVACFTPGQGNVERTVMGQPLEEIAAWAGTADLAALGVNCGVGAVQMEPVVGRLRGLTGLPLWVKPNAGMPRMEAGKVSYPEGPEEFAASCGRMAVAGARFLGGCCGTTPTHIRALARRVSGS